MKDVVVIGSSGFIGQNLLKNLPKAARVSLREKAWENSFNSASVIINLVGKAHDHKKEATEEDYYYVNTELAKQVFEAFVKTDAKLLIHVSSLAAIEEFESVDLLTEADDCRPESWYGESKRKAEEWLLAQNMPVDKKLIILRPPMVHGPGDKGNLGLLYKLISKGIPYPLSSFDNRRSFICIDNFCYYILQIIENQDKLESGIYHVSDDETVSTKEIISIIKKVINKNVPDLALPKSLVRVIAKVGDILPIPLNSKRLRKMTSDLVMSNEKIKKALGIEKLPLTAKEGLEKTIRSFKNGSN